MRGKFQAGKSTHLNTEGEGTDLPAQMEEEIRVDPIRVLLNQAAWVAAGILSAYCVATWLGVFAVAS